jgi:predicted enzyme related to lactoylglutathione lyase
MEKPVVLRVLDVFVHVEELARAREWYAELLGAEAGRVDPASPIHHFNLGDGPGLLLDDNRNNRTGHRPLCMLQVEDIEAVHRWLEGKGAQIEGEVERHGKVLFLRFYDTEGNALMAIEKVR